MKKNLLLIFSTTLLIIILLSFWERSNRNILSNPSETLIITQSNSSTSNPENKANLFHNKIDTIEESTGISQICLGFVDNYVNDEKLSTLYKSDDIFSRLQGFNQELNSYKHYYEVSFQTLQYFGYYTLDEQFVKVYNRKGQQIHNQSIRLNGEDSYVTSLNVMQVNKNFNDQFLEPCNGGPCFENSDFIQSTLETIPIWVGSNYQQYYQIGDSMTLNYLESDLNFEIKGFFSPNATLILSGDIVHLDNYICVPNFQFVSETPITEEHKDFIFLMRYYLQNNAGYMCCLSPSDIDEIQKIIDNLNSKYNLDYSIMDNFFTFESKYNQEG